MSDVDALRSEVHALKVDVAEQFRGIRTDLKALTETMRELVRLDGDIKRLGDVVARVGLESDDHEKRLRALESAAVETKKSVRLFDVLVTEGAKLALGGVLGMALLKALGG